MLAVRRGVSLRPRRAARYDLIIMFFKRLIRINGVTRAEIIAPSIRPFSAPALFRPICEILQQYVRLRRGVMPQPPILVEKRQERGPRAVVVERGGRGIIILSPYCFPHRLTPFYSSSFVPEARETGLHANFPAAISSGIMAGGAFIFSLYFDLRGCNSGVAFQEATMPPNGNRKSTPWKIQEVLAHVRD